MMTQDCCFSLFNGAKKACWVLTDTCNLTCDFCAANSRHTEARYVMSVPAETLEQVVGICGAKGIRKVVLSGGEPLLIPNISEIVLGLVDKGITVSMCTNGTLLTDSVLRVLRDSGLAKLSIGIDCFRQGLRPSKQRRFAPPADILRIVEKAKLDYELSVVLLPEFMGISEAFAEWLKHYRPTSVSLIEPQACGRLAGAIPARIGDPETRVRVARELAAKAVTIPVVFVSPRCGCEDCPSQRQVFGIRPDGTLGECPWKRNLVGLKKATLETPLALAGAVSG